MSSAVLLMVTSRSSSRLISPTRAAFYSVTIDNLQITAPPIFEEMSSSGTSISSLSLDPTSNSDSDGAAACGEACQHKDRTSDYRVFEDEDFYDVLVIGGGLNGLALVSRLRESHPPSIYTDLEQARIRWLGGRQHTKVKGSQRKLVGRPSSKAPKPAPKIAVLDAAGADWMQQWRNYFHNLNIRHLRSPMFFHPSPHTDSLVAYAYSQGRESDLREIPVVGKDYRKKSKRKVNQVKDLVNERDRQDYFTPSRALFNDYVQHELVDRFDCQDLIQQGRATDVEWLEDTLHVRGSGLQSGFRVTFQFGPAAPPRQVAAKAVVLAMGPAGTPNIPVFLQPYRTMPNKGVGWCHSSVFAQMPSQLSFAAPVGKSSSAYKKLLIIGGGLTSAQIAELGLTRGFSHVTLLCRSRFKAKYFDLDLEWVSKYGNLHKMKFFQEDCLHHRLQYFREAKGGGSVTPQYKKICDDLCKRGLLTVREHASVSRASYTEDVGWEVFIGEDPEASAEHYDYIVSATGVKMDIENVPVLEGIRKSHPIDYVEGFPCLTEDLAWRDDLPLFMMGGYSLLQAGPAAFNLVSTRETSERIVHALASRGLLGQSVQSDNEREETRVHGGLFSCLEQE